MQPESLLEIKQPNLAGGHLAGGHLGSALGTRGASLWPYWWRRGSGEGLVGSSSDLSDVDQVLLRWLKSS